MAPASAQGPFCLTPDDRRHELVLCPVCRRVSMPCIISAASLLPIALLYERNIRRGHDFVRADPREDGAMAGLYVIWCRDRRFHRPWDVPEPNRRRAARAGRFGRADCRLSRRRHGARTRGLSPRDCSGWRPRAESGAQIPPVLINTKRCQVAAGEAMM